MDEQILLNYTKSQDTYLLSINGTVVRKVVNKEDEKSLEFTEKLLSLIREYYG